MKPENNFVSVCPIRFLLSSSRGRKESYIAVNKVHMHGLVAEDSDTNDLANRKLTRVKVFDGSTDLKTGTSFCHSNCLGQSNGDVALFVDKVDGKSRSWIRCFLAWSRCRI